MSQLINLFIVNITTILRPKANINEEYEEQALAISC